MEATNVAIEDTLQWRCLVFAIESHPSVVTLVANKGSLKKKDFCPFYKLYPRIHSRETSTCIPIVGSQCISLNIEVQEKAQAVCTIPWKGQNYPPKT